MDYTDDSCMSRSRRASVRAADAWTAYRPHSHASSEGAASLRLGRGVLGVSPLRLDTTQRKGLLETKPTRRRHGSRVGWGGASMLVRRAVVSVSVLMLTATSFLFSTAPAHATPTG